MSNNLDDERRRELEDFYKSLTPEERRERILLEPAFRDLYNEITTAHRVVQVPHYFWAKWVPVLGPLASTLYMQLRQYCYYNPRTGERRDWCWPKQTTLCSDIGVGSRNTLLKGLKLLEEHGFIRREKTYYLDQHSGRPHQGTDKYYVYFEIPLTVTDAAELLIRETAKNADSPYVLKKGAHSNSEPKSVENPPYVLKNRAHIAEEKLSTRTNTRSNTDNVNVKESKKGKEELDESVNYLAQLIADTLEDPNSLGFYRRCAQILPKNALWSALSETKDAHRTGQVRTSRGRYFTDLVKRYAQKHDLDLGLKSGARSEQSSG